MNFSHALELACDAHAGQVDKAGAPYILHCIRVANSVSSEEEKIVAILHDVLEDTALTEEDLLAAGFSKEVVDAVVCLTRAEGEKYGDYLERVAQNAITTQVKLADMLDNSNEARFGPNITEEQKLKCRKYAKKRIKLDRLYAKWNTITTQQLANKE